MNPLSISATQRERDLVVYVHLDMNRFLQIHPCFEGRVHLKITSFQEEFVSHISVNGDSPRTTLVFCASFGTLASKGSVHFMCTAKSEGYDDDETQVYFSCSHMHIR